MQGRVGRQGRPAFLSGYLEERWPAELPNPDGMSKKYTSLHKATRVWLSSGEAASVYYPDKHHQTQPLTALLVIPTCPWSSGIQICPEHQIVNQPSKLGQAANGCKGGPSRSAGRGKGEAGVTLESSEW